MRARLTLKPRTPSMPRLAPALRRGRGRAAEFLEEAAPLADRSREVAATLTKESLERVPGRRPSRRRRRGGFVAVVLLLIAAGIALYLLWQRRDDEYARLVAEPDRPDADPVPRPGPSGSFRSNEDDGSGSSTDRPAMPRPESAPARTALSAEIPASAVPPSLVDEVRASYSRPAAAPPEPAVARPSVESGPSSEARQHEPRPQATSAPTPAPWPRATESPRAAVTELAAPPAPVAEVVEAAVEAEAPVRSEPAAFVLARPEPAQPEPVEAEPTAEPAVASAPEPEPKEEPAVANPWAAMPSSIVPPTASWSAPPALRTTPPAVEAAAVELAAAVVEAPRAERLGEVLFGTTAPTAAEPVAPPAEPATEAAERDAPIAEAIVDLTGPAADAVSSAVDEVAVESSAIGPTEAVDEPMEQPASGVASFDVSPPSMGDSETPTNEAAALASEGEFVASMPIAEAQLDAQAEPTAEALEAAVTEVASDARPAFEEFAGEPEPSWAPVAETDAHETALPNERDEVVAEASDERVDEGGESMEETGSRGVRGWPEPSRAPERPEFERTPARPVGPASSALPPTSPAGAPYRAAGDQLPARRSWPTLPR